MAGLFALKKLSFLDRMMVRGMFALFFSLSLAILLWGLAWSTQNVAFVLTSNKSTGQIIGREEVGADKKNLTYRPIFTFTNMAAQFLRD